MELHNPSLTVALALAAGMLAQAASRHLRLPGIVVLLLIGVILGPEMAGVVQPELLGNGLHMLVGLAVAVILFEGGLNLNIGRLRREGKVIRRLVTVGALITAIGGMLAAKLLLGWGWRPAVLFGTLVIVTGPTVVTPLLRRLNVNRNLHTVLEAEGVLIDPIGAIVAVVALEAVLTGGSPSALPASGAHLVYRLGFGLAAGLAGGVVIALLLRTERIIPDGLENVLSLALVLAVYETSNAVVQESGIMAVTVAGLVVGNMRTHVKRELQEFKEQLTVLLIGMLFVLLAADVRLEHVQSLGWLGVVAVGVLMIAVRPLEVAVCTAGSSMTRRERIFMSWMAPRGIVAAAVASLFAERLNTAGIPNGNELRALVFMVIAITVTVQGLTGGPLAAVLGVKRRTNNGYALVGANPVGRALARSLRVPGEEVVLIDLNASECRAAESEGFKVIYGNANEERTLYRADVGSRRGFAGVTPNEGLNLLLAQRVKQLTKAPRLFVTLERGKSGVKPAQVHESGGAVLFGRPVDLELWSHRLRKGSAVLERWRYTGSEVAVAGSDAPDALFRKVEAILLPLALTRGKRATPMSDDVRLRDKDVVTVGILGDKREQAVGWLVENHFEAVEPDATDPTST